MTLILNDIANSAVCYCNCCSSTFCTPVYIGALSVSGNCNTTTCNQNVCFTFNATQCPAFGAPGNVYSICASYSIFQHLNIVPIIMTLTFFLYFQINM
jgi:hypothetical protein